MKLNTNLSTLHKKTNLQDKHTEIFGAAQKILSPIGTKAYACTNYS